MFTVPKATKPPKISRRSVRSWSAGTVTSLDDGRTPDDGLRSSGNLILEQDSVARPRPSLTPYGPQPTGVVQGEIFEYQTHDGLTPTNWMISLQRIPQNEVQTLSITGSPTGGTFTITYSGQTTAAIAYNASAAAVQAALEALSNIAVGDVTCAGGTLPGTAVTITFTGALANIDVDLITATSSLTGGTAPAIVRTETTKGGDHTYAFIALGEDDTWTKCTGKTFDTEAKGHFCQIKNKVLIMNGVDNLSYLGTSGTTITSYTALSTPAAPTLDTLTGLTGSAFNVYYAITANSTVGETAGSAVLSQDVLIDRDLWNPETQSVKIEWTTVTGVQSWNVYMGISADGTGTPSMYLIAGGLDATILSFTDNGTRAQDLSRPLPTADSTAGPKATRGTVINGRPWLSGDADNPFYVWRGGDFDHELDFSPAFGGGYSPIGDGTKEIPVSVVPFRSGTGESKVTVLTQGSNGHGTRYLLSPTTVTYGATSFIVWQVDQDSGHDGTDSPDGVLQYNNSLWYPSRDGFKTTGTQPQLQNVLSTDRVSNTIQSDISSLNTSAMGGCVGLAYEGRLYWALPVGGTMNNQIWVLDIDRKGAWMKPWNISADWITLYNDNNGVTHFLILSENGIYELSRIAKTADNGVSFSTSGTSGHLTFSEDGRMWGRLIKVIFVLLRPQGSINFTVTGKTEDEVATFTETGTFAARSTRAGWSEPRAGWSSLRGWSEIVTVPQVLNEATQEVEIEVDEDMQWFTYAWNTEDAGVDYSLSDVIAVYVDVGIKDLT